MGNTTTRVEIESPYHDNIESFDDQDSSPDMEFFVPGMRRPLKLHRKIMSAASNLVKDMLKQHESDESNDDGGWKYDMSREMDRDALEKVMRFCYGEKMEVEAENGECCAVIAALYRLQVTCVEETVKKIRDFALDESKKDFKIGVKLLKDSLLYPECCIMGGCGLDRALAQIVLTADNVYNDYETVVNGCLMKLPRQYLDMVEYGDAHTKYSEFHIRMEYVKQHLDSLSIEQNEMILEECNWSELNYEELKELREIDIVEDKKLLDAFQNVLEKTEKERDELKQKTIERPSDDESEFI